jgi:hypothetical protein
MRSSNHRASLALLLGLAAAAAVPVAVVLSRQTVGVRLLDAVWAIPVAAVCGVAALLFARGAGGRIRTSLERAGGFGRIRLGRVLAVVGICVALSASIAVGFYELLLRLEG